MPITTKTTVTESSQDLTPMDINTATLRSDIDSQAKSLANEMVRQIIEQNQISRSGRIFTRLDPVNDIVYNQKREITNIGIAVDASVLTAVNTTIYKYAPADPNTIPGRWTDNYFLNVYRITPDTSGVAGPIPSNNDVLFSISFGATNGFGCSNSNITKSIYGQYRMLLLDNPTDRFFEQTADLPDYIYAININRSYLKEKISTGVCKFNIKYISAGTESTLELAIDATTAYHCKTGTYYNIKDELAIYGRAYIESGILILNYTALKALSTSTFPMPADGTAQYLNQKLFNSLYAAAYIYIQSVESIASTHYFIRVKNAEYNYTNNPSFISDTLGTIKYPSFISDPRTYITTIGLYNDNNELLAIAKLSTPIMKSFSDEVLIKLKLDF